MKMVLGPTAGSSGGSNTIDLTATKSLTCSQHQPDRNRHCVLAVPWSGMTVPKRSRRPALRAEFVPHEPVLSAERSSAQQGDEVVVGSSDDNRNIHQGRTKLSSTLYTGSQHLRSV